MGGQKGILLSIYTKHSVDTTISSSARREEPLERCQPEDLVQQPLKPIPHTLHQIALHHRQDVAPPDLLEPIAKLAVVATHREPPKADRMITDLLAPVGNVHLQVDAIVLLVVEAFQLKLNRGVSCWRREELSLENAHFGFNNNPKTYVSSRSFGTIRQFRVVLVAARGTSRACRSLRCET